MNTYSYYVYLGRDRDDWSGPHTIEAVDRATAIRNAQTKWAGTGYTVWRSKMKPTENQ